MARGSAWWGVIAGRYLVFVEPDHDEMRSPIKVFNSPAASAAVDGIKMSMPGTYGTANIIDLLLVTNLELKPPANGARRKRQGTPSWSAVIWSAVIYHRFLSSRSDLCFCPAQARRLHSGSITTETVSHTIAASPLLSIATEFTERSSCKPAVVSLTVKGLPIPASQKAKSTRVAPAAASR
jgi:hypothetical protein